MNHLPPESWQELAQIWKAGDATVTVQEIEALHARQQRRLRIARMAGLFSSMLGVMAALWLAVGSRFLWVGVVTVVFSVGSVLVVFRAQWRVAPHGAADLRQSLEDSLAYLDWLAEQLRYGRILGFMALFAVVMSASVQLMRMASVPPSGMLATVTAGMAISAALAWNMVLAWQAWRRTARLQAFRAKLEMTAPAPPTPG